MEKSSCTLEKFLAIAFSGYSVIPHPVESNGPWAQSSMLKIDAIELNVVLSRHSHRKASEEVIAE